MKDIYIDAKEQFNNCILLGDCENESVGGGSPEHQTKSAIRTRQVHSLAIRNTSSYDTMERPFRPDNLRGRWAKTADFYFASSSFAFSTMIFSDTSVWALNLGGWKYFLSAYLLSVIFYSLPTSLMQTFLGQFSTSGAISAFRVSPIFKGIGYSILMLNLGSLTYYSINAAVPLVYAVNSMHEVLPWLSCNNTWNTPNCSTHDYYDDEALVDPHSTEEYFFNVIASKGKNSTNLSISWSMLVAVIGIWFIVLFLLFNKISFIGKFLRCACVLMFGFFVAVFAYMIIHEQFGWEHVREYTNSELDSPQAKAGAIGVAIMQACVVLGPGWGSALTLGSYNSFRSDAERLNIWVSVTYVLITVMALVCGHIALDNYELHVSSWQSDKVHTLQFVYLAYGYLFGKFTTLPNLWTFLFFSILFMAELCALIIQMISVLTALFDEFELLRPRKRQVTILLVLCLLTTSVYYCTQLGFSHMSTLTYMSLFTQFMISGVLILMTTWIYGQVRFQCDLQFMLGKTISSFKIFCIRFVAPIFIMISLVQICYMLKVDGAGKMEIWIIQCLICQFAVGYMLFKLCQTNGSWRQRMRQCFAPHDWYPVNADNRRFYDEIMGTSEMLVINNENI